MKTEAELERMHEAVVARFPGGLTINQFRQVTLESADEDGRIYPPSISVPKEPLAVYSLLFSMWFEGLLENKGDGSDKPKIHQPIRYFVTDKGRAWLAENSAVSAGHRQTEGGA